jgi:hypothetical protein
MLKMVAAATRKGTDRRTQVVMLGLSYLNLDRLKAGQPITFPGEHVNLPNTDFIIFAGESEAKMQHEMQELIKSE